MKICWDRLEHVILNDEGNFGKKGATYVYMESCEECGESYLTIKSDSRKYCGQSCARMGDRNPAKSIEARRKIVIANTGRKQTDKARANMSLAKAGTGKGELNHNYKGGVKKLNIPLYDSYAEKLCGTEECRNSPDNFDYLEVKCTYCGKWFVPKTSDITERIKAINGKGRGERRLYCSEGCKKSCSIYGRRKFPKGFRKGTAREVQPDLRKMVLLRDSFQCQKCSASGPTIQLHCHHITGIVKNPIESADVDNCITLCKSCHKEVHTWNGCKYQELRCN